MLVFLIGADRGLANICSLIFNLLGIGSGMVILQKVPEWWLSAPKVSSQSLGQNRRGQANCSIVLARRDRNILSPYIGLALTAGELFQVPTVSRFDSPANWMMTAWCFDTSNRSQFTDIGGMPGFWMMHWCEDFYDAMKYNANRRRKRFHGGQCWPTGVFQHS